MIEHNFIVIEWNVMGRIYSSVILVCTHDYIYIHICIHWDMIFYSIRGLDVRMDIQWDHATIWFLIKNLTINYSQQTHTFKISWDIHIHDSMTIINDSQEWRVKQDMGLSDFVGYAPTPFSDTPIYYVCMCPKIRQIPCLRPFM